MAERRMNEFYDINKFPAQEGMLLFGISIPKIGNVQSAKKCFDYVEHLVKKVEKPHVGLNFIYSDSLYLYTSQKANMLKAKHQALLNSHKFEFKKLLNKHKWYIQQSFNFISWSQLLLESGEFFNLFGRLIYIYESDVDFKRFVSEDIKESGKKVSKDSVNFVLEEILVFYLASKGKLRLLNDYVQDKEKWILWCYPGKPLKSEIYLYQKNFFKLHNQKNKYENCYYDLDQKILYDYSRVDLKTFL